MAAQPGDTRTIGPAGAGSVGAADAGLLLKPEMVLAGRYRVVAFVAQGGMGEVYSAHDVRLAEDIAIKVLRGGGLDSTGMKQLIDETKVARRVTHPNVCRVFDLETDGPLTFLTMELLAGETLATLLERKGKLPADEVVPLLSQLAQGLDAAHQAGVVHRDFKPSNVLLVGNRAVITDFGIARLAAARTTKASGMKGSPAYMAPEQVEGKKVTPAADLYALGVAAFELLTGKQPFVGENAMAVAVARLKGSAPSARSIEPSVPPAISAAIEKMLERDPAARFASAGEFVKSLTDPPPKKGLWARLFG